MLGEKSLRSTGDVFVDSEACCMTLTTTQSRWVSRAPALRLWGCSCIALILFVCLIGLPSSQASDVSLVSAALEDWDEMDPDEDKGLPFLSDHQPDLAGAFLALPIPAVPSSTVHPQRLGGSSYLPLRSSIARAPPAL